MNFLRLFLFSIFLAGSSQATAQQKEPRISWSIIQTQISGSKPLTRSMHSDFWREMKKGPPMDPARLKLSMVGALSLNIEYQLAAWQSARESMRRARVIRSQELEKLESKYLASLAPIIPTDNAVEHQKAMGELARSFAFMKDDTARLLTAAARRGPYFPRGGQPIAVDENTVSLEVKKLGELQGRLDKLFDPVWREN